jgi:hypothetical protein
MILSTGCATTSYPAPDDERGFVPLFDGKSLGGWEIFDERGEPARPDGFYVDDEGNIVCAGYNWHWLRYRAKPFANFILRMEFKIAEGTNSGVVLRSRIDTEKAPPFTGFEVQIYDDTLDEPPKHPTSAIFDPMAKAPTAHSTGAIYDMVTPMYNAGKPIGQWNDLEIIVDGHRVIETLNGWKVIDTDFSKFTKPVNKFDFAYADMPSPGYIALQDHGTPVWYRNIRIHELPD